MSFGDHDKERVNRSCVLLLESLTYFNTRSDQTTEILVKDGGLGKQMVKIND